MDLKTDRLVLSGINFIGILVITSDNPKKGEELRPGDIQVMRAKSRSVFNFWKDCLVSGFRTAAGIEGIGADLSDPNR